MSKRVLGIGLIGFGWMGQSHSRAYRNIEVYFPGSATQPRLVAMADPVQERVETAVEHFGYQQGGGDWREVVHHPGVEIVDITAPNAFHRMIAEEAAAAGKIVFCEKPVGEHPEDTMAIARAIRGAGVLSGCGYNYRWAPLVQHVHALIQEGRFGRLTHYRGRFFSMYGRDPLSLLTWRFTDRSRYGTLTDIMSHAIDMALFLCGPIRRVVADRETFITHRPIPIPGEGTHYDVGSAADPTGPVTNEDYAGALVEFENGARGTFEVCRVIQGVHCQMAFEIHGTRGAARWDFERMNELQLYTVDGPHDGFVTLQSGPAYPGHGHFNPGPALGLGYDDLKVLETYHFLQSIAEGRQGEPGFNEALAVAGVLSAVERSWSSERWETVQGTAVD